MNSKAIGIAAIFALVVWSPEIPKVWDEAALTSMELPLAKPSASPKHASPDYYYRIPVRPIYKSYPIYAPGKEPDGYWEWLNRQEPEVAFDPSRLKTQADWIKAGAIVFKTPNFGDRSLISCQFVSFRNTFVRN